MRDVIRFIVLVALCAGCAMISDIYLHISGRSFIIEWAMCCGVFVVNAYMRGK